MKRRLCLALLSVLGCKPDTITGPDDAGPLDTPTERGRRSADTSTIELPVPADPSVSYSVWFRFGTSEDPKGKEGLAWLTAQLLAEGGTKSHPWREIVELLYPMAASWNVTVDRQMTVFRGRAHVDTAAAYEALLVQQYTEPAFDPADFERIRSEGLNYLRTTLRYASDEELGKAGLEWFVFGDSGYGHPSRGTVAGLESITLDDVREFYTNWYQPNNVVFGIGGRYSASSVATLEASRERLVSKPGLRFLHDGWDAPAVITANQVLLIDKPGADASISFGHPIDVGRGDPDFHALWLANSWFGEHRNSSSHLYQVIRETRGLNYGDYSYIEAFPGGGWRQMPPANVGRHAQLFSVWIRTLPNEHAVFALKAAHRELVDLVEQGMTQEQFELTREFLRKYALHYAETTQARLGVAIDDRFYGLDPGHLDGFTAALDALTLDQVNAAIRKHLRPHQLRIVIVTGQASTLRDQLLSSGPTGITYPSAKPDAVLAEDVEIAKHPMKIGTTAIAVVPVGEMFAR